MSALVPGDRVASVHNPKSRGTVVARHRVAGFVSVLWDGYEQSERWGVDALRKLSSDADAEPASLTYDQVKARMEDRIRDALTASTYVRDKAPSRTAASGAVLAQERLHDALRLLND